MFSRHVLVFLNGSSAGLIAALFPRLFTFVDAAGDKSLDDITVILFSPGYWLVCALFAVIIGTAMVWIYWDATSESPKNLFMAALAVPSVLSGGLNMSNATTEAGRNIQELQQTNSQLNEELRNQLGIPRVMLGADEVGDIETIEIPDSGLLMMWPVELLLGISPAYAEAPTSSPTRISPSVRFQSVAPQQHYRISLTNTTDLSEAISTIEAFKSEGILDLELVRSNTLNRYFILTGNTVTESDGLLQAVRLQKEYAGIHMSPALIGLRMPISQSEDEETEEKLETPTDSTE